jgi:hypothetical protein
MQGDGHNNDIKNTSSLVEEKTIENYILKIDKNVEK